MARSLLTHLLTSYLLRLRLTTNLLPCQEGVAIRGLLTDESGATSLTLKGNRILRGGAGVRLADNAKGFVKENEIEGCAGAGLDVSTGAEPEAASNAL